MELADDIFRRKAYDAALLAEYGFKQDGDRFIYSTTIVDGRFSLTVEICGGSVSTDVIEVAFNEPFVLYHVDGAAGSFVGRVRAEAEKALLDVAEKCFYTKVFKTEQAQACIKYIRAAYGNELEYLWQKFPDNAIWRRSDNGKWYGALLTVAARKLDIDADGTLEIIDLRMEPSEKERLLDGDRFLAGYHMNKNSWYTVILDGRVPDAELFKLIDKSYELAKKK